jgi:hypothetical protein
MTTTSNYDPKILAHPDYQRSYKAYLQTSPPEEAARLAYAWTAAQRRGIDPQVDALETAVTNSVNAGWTVESRSATQAVFTSGDDDGSVNHVVHVLLCIFTLGLWLPIWLLVAIFGRSSNRRRIVATAYEDGTVLWSDPVTY